MDSDGGASSPEPLAVDHQLRQEVCKAVDWRVAVGHAVEIAVADCRQELERRVAEEAALRRSADAENTVQLEQLRRVCNRALEVATASNPLVSSYDASDVEVSSAQNSWEKVQEAFQIGHAELNTLRDLVAQEMSERVETGDGFQRHLNALEARVERGTAELLQLREDLEAMNVTVNNVTQLREADDSQQVEEKADQQQQHSKRQTIEQQRDKMQLFVEQMGTIDLDGRLDQLCSVVQDHKTTLDERLSSIRSIQEDNARLQTKMIELQAAVYSLEARVANMENLSRSSSVASLVKVFSTRAPEGTTSGQRRAPSMSPIPHATDDQCVAISVSKPEQVHWQKSSSQLRASSSSPVFFSLEARLAGMEAAGSERPARSSAVASLVKRARVPEGTASGQGSTGHTATPAPCITPLSDATEPYDVERFGLAKEQVQNDLERFQSPLRASSWSLRSSSRDAEPSQDKVRRLAAGGPCHAPMLAGVHASPRQSSPGATGLSVGMLPPRGSSTPDPGTFRRELSTLLPPPAASNALPQHGLGSRPQRTTSSRGPSHSLQEPSQPRVILASPGASQARTVSSSEPQAYLPLAYPPSVARMSSGSPIRVAGTPRLRAGDSSLSAVAQQSQYLRGPSKGG